MGKDVLQSISKLESINVTKTELNIRIDDKLSQTKDFSTKVERISETRLFAFFGGQSLDGLQVQIIVQMKVVQIL